MKLHVILKTFSIYFCIILVFSVLYYFWRDHFENTNNNNIPVTLYDCINLSTTIQTTIGITNIYPLSDFMTSLVLLQQVLTMPSFAILGYITTIL